MVRVTRDENCKLVFIDATRSGQVETVQINEDEVEFLIDQLIAIKRDILYRTMLPRPAMLEDDVEEDYDTDADPLFKGRTN